MTEVNIALEIFCMVITVPLIFYCVIEAGEKDSRTKLLLGIIAFSFFDLFVDCIGWIIDGNVEYTILAYVLASMACLFDYIIIIFFTYYLFECIALRKKISRKFAHVTAAVGVVFAILIVISVFNHMYFSIQDGLYVRGPLFWLSHTFSLAVLFVDMIIVFIYCRVLGWLETLSLLSYGFIPLIMILIQIRFYGLALINSATTLSVLIIYIGVHVEQRKQLRKQETELAEIKLSVLLSQIQPHFLYNCLTAIGYLCDKEPKTAKWALLDFAQYMRGNLDSINSRELIPFKNELEHTKKFLRLEQLRYEERLNVLYDIQEEDFLCPALTLQLIVENAVKYGVCNREEGGSITIRTEQKDNNFYMIVKDNGAGINAETMDDIPEKKDGKSHLGLKNVRYRVRIMTGGDVQFVSRLGEGTTVIITIPREGNI